jgi:hypothetical protein
MSSNEWRQKENMNPIDDPSGDAYFMPLNMIDMKQALLPAASTDESGSRGTRPGLIRSGADRRRTVTDRFKDRYMNLGTAILSEEIPAIREILSANPENRQELIDALERFYEGFAGSVSRMAAGLIQVNSDEIRSLAEKEIGAVMADAEYENFLSRFIENFGLRYSIRSKQDLRSKETVEEMEERTESWKDTRPGQISRERIAVESAIARTVWRSGGVRKIKSVAKGENCPYCDELNGRVIGIEESFLEPGEFQPDGAEIPLRVSSRKHHPPYHDGCNCGIEPVVE